MKERLVEHSSKETTQQVAQHTSDRVRVRAGRADGEGRQCGVTPTVFAADSPSSRAHLPARWLPSLDTASSSVVRVGLPGEARPKPPSPLLRQQPLLNRMACAVLCVRSGEADRAVTRLAREGEYLALTHTLHYTHCDPCLELRLRCSRASSRSGPSPGLCLTAPVAHRACVSERGT